MDFVVGLHRSKRGSNSIFMVLDKFSKTVHIANLFFKEIVRLLDMLKSIVSVEMLSFLSFFLENFMAKLRTKLLFSTFCHPQISGQIEAYNRTLSTLLHAMIQKNLKTWEECLPHIKCAYNMSVLQKRNFHLLKLCMVLIHLLL